MACLQQLQQQSLRQVSFIFASSKQAERRQEVNFYSWIQQDIWPFWSKHAWKVVIKIPRQQSQLSPWPIENQFERFDPRADAPKRWKHPGDKDGRLCGLRSHLLGGWLQWALESLCHQPETIACSLDKCTCWHIQLGGENLRCLFGWRLRPSCYLFWKVF